MGVTKQLYKIWNKKLSKKEKKMLNDRMANIRLPRDFQRVLRPLDLANKYKALEWEIWLLFVSVPSLHGILPDEMFRSYLLFVHSIYTLLKDSIIQEEIDDCEYKILQFVGECQILYGLQFVTFNVHSLLHYCESVRKTGPLWANSAFPFESFISQFLKDINAPNGCCKQIAEKWMKRCEFQDNLEYNRSNSKNSVEYCKSVMDSKILLKNYCRVQNAILIGTGYQNNNVEKLISKFTENQDIEVLVFERCIFNSVTLHSVKYTRVKKNDDSVIELLCGKIIQIHYLVKTGNDCFVCGYEWTMSKNSFNEPNEQPALQHIFALSKRNSNLVVHNINNFNRKVIVIDIGNQVYGSFFPNNYKTQ